MSADLRAPALNFSAIMTMSHSYLISVCIACVLAVYGCRIASTVNTAQIDMELPESYHPGASRKAQRMWKEGEIISIMPVSTYLRGEWTNVLYLPNTYEVCHVNGKLYVQAYDRRTGDIENCYVDTLIINNNRFELPWKKASGYIISDKKGIPHIVLESTFPTLYRMGMSKSGKDAGRFCERIRNSFELYYSKIIPAGLITQ